MTTASEAQPAVEEPQSFPVEPVPEFSPDATLEESAIYWSGLSADQQAAVVEEYLGQTGGPIEGVTVGGIVQATGDRFEAINEAGYIADLTIGQLLEEAALAAEHTASLEAQFALEDAKLELLGNRDAVIGMTKRQIRQAIGEPDYTQEIGAQEFWYYEIDESSYYQLIIDGNVVIERNRF